jgi:hypothetical protein
MVFLLAFLCGVIGAVLEAAVNGFRSGSRQVGGIMGVGLGFGLAQSLGLCGGQGKAAHDRYCPAAANRPSEP